MRVVSNPCLLAKSRPTVSSVMLLLHSRILLIDYSGGRADRKTTLINVLFPPSVCTAMLLSVAMSHIGTAIGVRPISWAI